MKRNILTLLFAAMSLVLSGEPVASPDISTQALQTYTQASAYYKAKDFANALKSYQTASSQRPNFYQATQGQANCYYALGDKVKALEIYQLAKTQGGNAGGIDSMIARIKRELQNPAKQASSNDESAQTLKPTHSWLGGVARSALLPGWGQIYNDQYVKAVLIGGTTWAALGTTIWGFSAVSSARQRYRDAKTVAESDQAFSDWESANTIGAGAMYIFLGLYIYNVVDAGLRANKLHKKELRASFDAPITLTLSNEKVPMLVYTARW